MFLAPDGPLHPALGAGAVATALAVQLACARCGLDPVRACIVAMGLFAGVSGLGAVPLVVAAVVVIEALPWPDRVDRRSIGVLCAAAVVVVVAARVPLEWASPLDRIASVGVASVVAVGVVRLSRAAPALVVAGVAAAWLWATVPDTEAPLALGAGALVGVAAALVQAHRGVPVPRRSPAVGLGVGALVVWALAEGVAGRPAAAPRALAGLLAVVVIAPVVGRCRAAGRAPRSPSLPVAHRR